MTDKLILEGILNRDEGTIAWVIQKYSRLLWSVADAVLKNIGSSQDTEECVADVFILLWQSPQKFDPERGSLKNWLSMVARSRAIDRYRELSRHATVSLDDAMIAGRIGIRDALLDREQRRELTDAIGALGELERDILLRRFYYGQKPTQIARALKLSVKQVDNFLYRTKRKLRKAIELGGEGYEQPKL